jgi:phosphate transport system substrate-binding protein
MGLSIVEQPGKNTWPISTASFIIMYKEPKDKKASDDVLKFFDWAFKNGSKMSEELDYVHLPESLQNEIRKRVWSQIKN